jgi:transposase InsO family protein
VRFRFIDDHRAGWPVRVLCRVLGVTAGGYYAWRRRPPSDRARRREVLAVEVKAVHAEVRARYGSPRIHAELAARGVRCCVNTVAKVMRACGVRAKARRGFRPGTDSRHDRPVADNVLGRDFGPAAPNASWVADITYVPTREGWAYLAAVEDLYSRKVVGWAVGDRATGDLVAEALAMAVARRRPGAGLVAHSDRGSQYAGEHYRRLLARHGLVCSMSRKGNCWDNAAMESFFATLKRELVHGEDYRTRAEVRASVFEYIEGFYNRRRRHSALGYVSPDEYEQAA